MTHTINHTDGATEPFSDEPFSDNAATDTEPEMTANCTGTKLKVSDLKALAARRNGPGLFRIAFHTGSLVITGSVLWSLQGTWLAIPLTLVHGYVLAFLFCAQHETAHRTAFRSRWMNDVVGHVIAFLIFLPQKSFRLFHWDHHRYTQDPQRDPELANSLPTTRAGLLWTWLGWPNWWARVASLVRHGLMGRVDSPWIPQRQRPVIIREAQLHLAGYALLLIASLMLQSTALLWLWLLPMVCGYWFLRPYLLTEHTGCANVGAMADKTRTTFTNRLVHAYAWNMPYHTEHHVYPAVPFHALAQLHARMAKQLINTEHGYLTAWRRIVNHLIKAKNSANS